MSGAAADALAVYGTLRRGRPQNRLLVETGARYLGDCVIEAVLYDLGPYPGLAPGPGRIAAELYKLPAGYDFTAADAYEGCDPAQPTASLYLRRPVRLLVPAGRAAWVYFYNQPIDAAAPVQTEGAWRADRSVD